MLLICDGPEQIFRPLPIRSRISAVLLPFFHHEPIQAKLAVPCRFQLKIELQPRQSEQGAHVVCIGAIEKLAIRKVVTPCLLRNACS